MEGLDTVAVVGFLRSLKLVAAADAAAVEELDGDLSADEARDHRCDERPARS
jgi:hypothetical protein